MLIDPLQKFITARSPVGRCTRHPRHRGFSEVNNAAKKDAYEWLDDDTMAALREMGAFSSQLPAELEGP